MSKAGVSERAKGVKAFSLAPATVAVWSRAVCSQVRAPSQHHLQLFLLMVVHFFFSFFVFLSTSCSFPPFLYLFLGNPFLSSFLSLSLS